MCLQNSKSLWSCCEDANKSHGFFHNEYCEVTKDLSTWKLELEYDGIFVKIKDRDGE